MENRTFKGERFIMEENEIQIVMFATQIMPESTDPMGSERKRCTIIVYLISAPFDEVRFIDNIDEDGSFIVIEFSKTAGHWDVVSGAGIVLRERGGDYSWWFNDITK